MNTIPIIPRDQLVPGQKYRLALIHENSCLMSSAHANAIGSVVAFRGLCPVDFYDESQALRITILDQPLGKYDYFGRQRELYIELGPLEPELTPELAAWDEYDQQEDG